VERSDYFLRNFRKRRMIQLGSELTERRLREGGFRRETLTTLAFFL
jgi:hypothetical protein